MFNESYKEIFEKRGKEYDLAMCKFPNARDEEFFNIINIADLKDNQSLLDIPSGGCYLKRYIPGSVNYLPIETTETFANFCRKNNNIEPIVVENIHNLPFKNESIDRIISLAGIHHLTDKDKEKFYIESFRILKKGGIFALADVFEGTPSGRFLNEFVDKYNPMGHKGIFLNKKTTNTLENIGFRINFSEVKNYYWKFKTQTEMIEFIKLLFGIFKADNNSLLEGLNKYLGFIENQGQILLNWQLFFIKAIK